jgi:predicted transcriptional regulator
MRELTKAEEQVMQVLWKIEKGFLKDLLEEFPEPKPAYTTVATVLKGLKNKGFVNYKVYGKIYEYYPEITKDAYFKQTFKGLVKNYFNNSFKKFASFFAGSNELSLSELEDLKRMIDDQITKKKTDG